MPQPTSPLVRGPDYVYIVVSILALLRLTEVVAWSWALILAPIFIGGLVHTLLLRLYLHRRRQARKSPVHGLAAAMRRSNPELAKHFRVQDLTK